MMGGAEEEKKRWTDAQPDTHSSGMELDTVFITLLLSAVFSSSSPHHFELVQESMSCSDALRYCRENYTDLASLDSSADVSELLRSVSRAGADRVWIGLMDSARPRWKWSLGDPAFYTANDSLYRSWASIQPSQYLCAYTSQDGLWRDDNCTNLRSFVCYNDSSRGLILEQQMMSWRNAQSYCRGNHRDLSSVRNQSENQQIQQLLRTTGVMTTWIGLFRDSWEWSDKSASSFRKWAPTEPNNFVGSENATVLVTSGSLMGQWEDWPCSTLFPFVCYEDELTLIKQNLSWGEAMAYCRQNHTDLVSAPVPQVERRVMTAARRASSPAVWMGLHLYCSMNMWLWLQGEVVCYQNWAPGNVGRPQDCSQRRVGAIPSSGDQCWLSLPPALRLNFICTNSGP